MIKENIRDLIHATPFKPFYIHTANGKSFLIHHPEFILAASDAPHVIVEELTGRTHTINVMLITSLEEVPACRQKQRNKG